MEQGDQDDGDVKKGGAGRPVGDGQQVDEGRDQGDEE